MANKYRRLTSEQLVAQQTAEEYYRQLEIEGEKAFAGINARAWKSYWDSQEKEERYWEHVSRMPRLQLRRVTNRNHGRRLHRRHRE